MSNSEFKNAIDRLKPVLQQAGSVGVTSQMFLELTAHLDKVARGRLIGSLQASTLPNGNIALRQFKPKAGAAPQSNLESGPESANVHSGVSQVSFEDNAGRSLTYGPEAGKSYTVIVQENAKK